MTDVFTEAQRSSVMRAVKSKGNKSTELKLTQYLREKGIVGWRRNYKLMGKPDFTFPKLKVAIFTDGCFWHGHNCRNITPAQNKDYWIQKRKRNIDRDLKVTEHLSNKNWTVIRIWECEIKKETFHLKLESLI